MADKAVLKHHDAVEAIVHELTGREIDIENKNTQKWKCQKPTGPVVCLVVVAISFSIFCALIATSRSMHREENVVLKLPSAPRADHCRLMLVETIPENLTFPPGSPSHPSVFEGWKDLILSANQTIDIASYYWTLRGKHIFEHPSSWQGEEIYRDLLKAGSKRGIKIRIVQTLPTKVFRQQDTADLVKAGAAEVRSLNFTHFEGRGLLHTKMMLVDSKHFYLGSANYDWRSLTQVKELGTITYDCPCLAKDMLKIFEGNWYMGAPNATIPPIWPPRYNTRFNLFTPMKLQLNGIGANVFLSSSPPSFCPSGRTKDINAILHVISKATKFVYVEVMNYNPTLQRVRFWPVLDDALRKVSLEKGVLVRLMVGWWNHTKAETPFFLRSLEAVSGALKARIEVRLFKVPAYTEDQNRIPHARVNHDKFIVTDNAAYIGTSNWEGHYYVNSAGIGYVISETRKGFANDATPMVRTQLLEVFERDWNSAYVHPVSKPL